MLMAEERTTTASLAAKPQRVLACVLCQQRKVKCDRKFPCANCVRSHVQCVPAATLAPRQRRRRFPERELLDRVRRYEDLLRQNEIQFESLHNDSPTLEKQPGEYESPDDGQRPPAVGPDPSSPSTTVKSETVYEAKNFWHAMNQTPQDPDDDTTESSLDDLRETVVKQAWEESLHLNDDHLLFGSRKTAVDISTLHPEQIQIFRLWQIYLDNVNPLLKVIHTPTLQVRIIEAASDVASIKPSLAALMFSIYCVAILSLGEEGCRAMFDSPRDQLLTRYQSGCQQALLNCGFLRTSDRDCLTALYLYLISAGLGTDPHSLSSMLSIAIRIAQRMGLHSEAACARYPALEAEMRRRLWWSLILFDTRICEMADYKAVMLTPIWDCKPPLNVNDFDLQVEMKDPPTVHGHSTEALFAVVRSEMGDVVRHSAFHLDFISPALKVVAQNSPLSGGDELATLEKTIDDKYLKFCNPQNPLHFMTIWTSRGYLAKSRLVEYFSRFSRSSVQPTDTERDAALSYALSVLECDTKLITSPFTKGYLWLVHFYFPLTAYIHITQDLRRRPVGHQTERCWEIMSENYEAHFKLQGQDDENPFFKLFAKVVLAAWEARQALFSQSEKELVSCPRIVSSIRRKVAWPAQGAQTINVEQPSVVPGTGVDDFSMFLPVEFGGQGMFYDMGWQAYGGLGTGHEQAVLEGDLTRSDWNTMDWFPTHGRGHAEQQ